MRNQTVEKPLESSLELAVVPGGVYGRCRTIAALENAILQSKSWQGLTVAGEFAPQSASLSKRFYQAESQLND